MVRAVRGLKMFVKGDVNDLNIEPPVTRQQASTFYKTIHPEKCRRPLPAFSELVISINSDLYNEFFKKITKHSTCTTYILVY